MALTYRRVERPRPDGAPPRTAAFLDRDGVIVEETRYLHRVEELRFIPGALEAVRRLNAAGLPVIEVSNQAGIGRGYYTWREFEAVQEAIEGELARLGGWLDGVWACACHPDGAGKYAVDHPWRKPNPGMLLDAAAELGLDLSASWMVGDKALDIEAAVNAGCGNAVLALTGYGAEMRGEVERRAAGEWSGRCRIHVAASLAEAVDKLLNRPDEPISRFLGPL